MITTVTELKKEYPILTAQLEQEAIEGNDGVLSDVHIIKNTEGGIKIWTEILRDRKGKQISKRIDTYNKDGSIILEKFDAKDILISSQKVK